MGGVAACRKDAEIRRQPPALTEIDLSALEISEATTPVEIRACSSTSSARRHDYAMVPDRIKRGVTVCSARRHDRAPVLS